MPQISIVIPVYNVESYLAKCLDSCINQSFKDIEIICINDGSTDNSLKILNEYSKKDSRIKVIDKENEGVSVARNIGIDKANGEYLLFLDSDDWLKENACELIYSKINSSGGFDILYFNIIVVHKNKTIKKRVITPFENPKNNFLIYSNDSIKSVFRRKFIKEHNITFPKGIKISEDHIFKIQLFKNNPKIELLDEYIYYYLADRENSATKNLENYIDNHLNSYIYIKNTDFYKKLDKQKQLYITDIWAYYMFSIWYGLKDYKYHSHNNEVVDNFLKFYADFEKSEYENLYGYKLLSKRYFYLIVRKLRNFILNSINKIKKDKK